jgi:mannosyl-3-phosphoglycerate phosphatase
MDVIFTDLDGSLLDRESYSWDAAVPALSRVERLGVPWVLVTSKTRAEMEICRASLGHRHPFIVENGGAAFWPIGYFGASIASARQAGDYEVMEWGTPYEVLVRDLEECAEQTGCTVRGFHQMTAAEVAAVCDLPLAQAEFAKQREYDEPFLIQNADRAEMLVRAVEEHGRRCTRGGRFWHILGANDKAVAVSVLTAAFELVHGDVRSIGIGDGLNDAAFLNTVSVPVLVRSPSLNELRAQVPHGTITDSEGPEGWNEAVLGLISA